MSESRRRIGDKMPERLTLREDWLVENMRSAVESVKHLNMPAENALSSQQLDTVVELAATRLTKPAVR
jgi:gamma-glutamyl phosphate reductase